MRNLYELTETENKVMMIAAKGYTISYIADKLCMAEQTVCNHLNHIYEKYGIKNQKEINPRVRAVFIYMQSLKIKNKIIAEFEAITEQIKQYKQWLEAESEEQL